MVVTLALSKGATMVDTVAMIVSVEVARARTSAARAFSLTGVTEGGGGEETKAIIGTTTTTAGVETSIDGGGVNPTTCLKA